MAYFYKLTIALSVPILILAVFITALYVFQNKLLYLPAKADLDNYVPVGMTLWPAHDTNHKDGSTSNILGLLAVPASDRAITGTAIIFHGNAGHAGHRTYYVQQLTALGLRVVLAEYPGYGPRRGKPDESVLVNDAINIVKLAQQRYGQPVLLIGESLGAGVVAAVAGREPTLVQGLIMITPWNQLTNVASHHYPYLPVRWLLSSDYDSVHSLKMFDGPVLVLVAERDTIVPTELGLDLYEKIKKPKRLIMVDGAGHNDWTMRIPSSLWTDALNWLLES